jgi:uncharacterized YkwD family protein
MKNRKAAPLLALILLFLVTAVSPAQAYSLTATSPSFESVWNQLQLLLKYKNPTPTPTPTPTPGYTLSQFEKKVVELVNIERTKAGLKPLATALLLSKGARAKSQDMIDKSYFSHTSPTYGSPFNMMKTFGISYQSAGENIAVGYSTPESVVKGWMNSPGHKANIMSANYGKIGIGYAYTTKGYHHYWTQWFTN